MITFFTTPKPFLGHIGIIQRNSIESWKRSYPDAEIIIFGDEEGTADAARQLQVRHIPDVKRNEHGTKYLSPIFDRAQEVGRHGTLCYINCDIILLSDFRAAADRVLTLSGRFLMAGQRWDTEIVAPIEFSDTQWEIAVRQKAIDANHQRPPQWIDYFLFSRGLYYKNIPPFVIGRPGWDNWLVWHARRSGARIVDATAVVQVVHQNHDYSYHPGGEAGVWQGDEAQQNYALLDGGRCFATMENATHRLTTHSLKPSYRHWPVQVGRKAAAIRSAIWFGLLNMTRPVRRRLGLEASHARETPSKRDESV